MRRYSCSWLTAVFFIATLVACSNNGKKWNPDDYTVKSGDTIYSIAWRYELDPEQFAKWNNIGRSHIIKLGQRLHTRKPYNYIAKTANKPTYSGQTTVVSKKNHYSNVKWVKVSKGDSLSGISKETGVSVNRLVQINQLKKPYIIQPGQTIYLKPLKVASRLSTNSVSSRSKLKANNKKKIVTVDSQTFRWPGSVKWKRPFKGKVVKTFNRSRNDAKGIEFKGKNGDTIRAAADGKVVYSGNGLISYGNLIIIKHNKTYLSAYAYNRKLLVSEGDVVKVGQKVAEMGTKEKNSPRLHFEIRKNGKPVNPLKYLPR